MAVACRIISVCRFEGVGMNDGNPVEDVVVRKESYAGVKPQEQAK